MRYDLPFAVRYLTDDPVPIREIIESLQGIEAAIAEAVRLLPAIVDGAQVEHIEVKVREISQESPLRELFAIALFMSFQKDLEAEVGGAFTAMTGHHLSPAMDTMFTVLVMIVVFYGVGAVKDLIVDSAKSGPASRQLDQLIAEIAGMCGKNESDIRKALRERYSDKPAWKRLINATGRFFKPSKQQDSAPVEINGRVLDNDIVRDIPSDYLVDAEAGDHPCRSFSGVELELHAQDKDHSGRGWAALIPGIVDERVRLKLMDEVASADVWGKDRISGDVTVVYDRIGSGIAPKEIHLHRISGQADS